MIDVYDMALAGLLHDIGKLMQRAEVEIPKAAYESRCPLSQSHISHSHVMWTEHFFQLLAEADPWWQEIANLAASHHKAEAYAKAADPEKLWLIQCLILGDRVSSRWDRPPDDEETPKGANQCKPLHSIFTDVCLGAGISKQNAFKISAKSQLGDAAFPSEIDAQSSKLLLYRELLKQFNTEFMHLVKAFSAGSIGKVNLIDALDSLLEKYLWSIPSNTVDAAPTDSLYYHSKNTAAVASALYLYYQAHPKLKSQLSTLDTSENQALILIGGDLSGIQSYLFDLNPEHSKGAAKTLRSRSFKIKMLCDIVLQRICRELSIPRQCILMNAGGKFMLLAPNTQTVQDYMPGLKSETEREFFQQFQGAISLNLDWQTQIRFQDLMMNHFPDTLDSFINHLEQSKLHKHSSYLRQDSAWKSENFVLQQPCHYANLCMQCGRRTVEQEGDTCAHCRIEIKLGEIIPKTTHYIIHQGQASGETHITLYDQAWVLEPFQPGSKIHDDDYVFCVKDLAGKALLHYPFKALATALPRYHALTAAQKHLLSKAGKDASERDSDVLSFDQLALLSMKETANNKYLGVPFNAVLKGDVDNLGNIFSLGLRYDRSGKKQEQGYSITQYATLSATIDWFFSAYLPEMIEASPKYSNKVYIVYTGGDDFCLIGPWNIMLDLAIELDREFKSYCGAHPDLHFSAALRLMHSKSPIRFAIQQAEEDLAEAKRYRANPDQTHPDKDAIYLFETLVPWQDMKAVMDWGDHFERWLRESEGKAKGFSTQFLYRLMQYTEMAQNFAKKQELRDLLYKSYLLYDLKRNFDAGADSVPKLQELAWLDKEMRYLRVPLHKTLYNNRKYTPSGGDHE